MDNEAMILKRDRGGRAMVPLARQIELTREYERSGLSGPKFAAKMPGIRLMGASLLCSYFPGSSRHNSLEMNLLMWWVRWFR